MHFESSIKILGLPLIQVAIGSAPGSSAGRGIARAWIAIGDIAFGVVLALGGLAFGGVAVGGLSVGVLAIAGLAVGVWSIGGLAVGLFAMGGAAVGWWAASGGFAVASEFAVGGAAIGNHANDAAARQYFSASSFFHAAEAAMRHAQWLVLLVLIAPLMALIRRLGRNRSR
jgi:hypothetical protein